MTYNIKLSPTVENALRMDAAAHGMNVEEWAGEVLARHYAQKDAPATEFLSLLEELKPEISAGLLRPLSSEEIARSVTDSRP